MNWQPAIAYETISRYTVKLAELDAKARAVLAKCAQPQTKE